MAKGFVFTIEAVIAMIAIAAIAFSAPLPASAGEPLQAFIAAQDAALTLGEKYSEMPPTGMELEMDKELLENFFPAYCFEISAGAAVTESCNSFTKASAARTMLAPTGFYSLEVSVSLR
ncbi:MAG: hypothetical protein AABW54_01530 [Candidatus Micrarchaeota archaeon]